MRATSRQMRATSAGDASTSAHRRSAGGTGRAGRREYRPGKGHAPVPPPARAPSGIPSRRRQISVTVAMDVSGDGEIGTDVTGAVGEQLDRIICGDSGGTRQVTSPAHADRLAAGRQDRQVAGHATQSAVDQCGGWRPADARSCPAPAACRRSPMNRISVSRSADRPLWSGRPKCTSRRDRHRVRIGDRRQIDEPNPVADLVPICAAISYRQTRLTHAAGARQCHQPVLGHELLARRSSALSRPTKVVSWVGRFWETPALDVRNGGNALRRSGWHSCTTRARALDRPRNGWGPQIESATRRPEGCRGRLRSVVARQYGLAAVAPSRAAVRSC